MAGSEILSVRVPATFAGALREAVEAGEYSDVDAALADALANWTRRHEDREEELAWMRAKIRASLADPRPSLSGEEVDAHLEAFFKSAERLNDEAA